MKYLIAGVIIAGLLAWLGRGRRRSKEDAPKDKSHRGSESNQHNDDRSGTTVKGESLQSMLRCAHCGLHLPDQEAVRVGELAYCSDEHRHQAQSRP